MPEVVSGAAGGGGLAAGGSGQQAGGAGGGAGGAVPVDECAGKTAPGHYSLRRLTNTEYTNTVRALLYTNRAPGTTFQEVPRGPSGYSNDSQTLAIFPTLVRGYYDAAVVLAKELVASKDTAGGAWSRVVTCDLRQAACVQSSISSFARRALRRPATPEEIVSFTDVFRAGNSPEQGWQDVVTTLLIHPSFLMLPVVDRSSTDPSAIFALDDYEFASRLSYFLWRSMPDDELFDKAATSTLRSRDVLTQQVKRMLASPKSQELRAMIRDEYADLAALGRSDFAAMGQTNALRDAMLGETTAFFDDLIANDRTPLLMLTSRSNFVNKLLADFYGVPFPSGVPVSQFVSVASGRTGIGSHASVLATSAGLGPFTNPIKRGHWITGKLMCSEPQPAPPNIPALPPMQGGGTFRQQFQAHLQPACAGCHVTMDNVGFGAENYDSLGRWRTTYANAAAVDSAGQFDDDTLFTNSREMFEKLAGQASAQSCIANQFMRMALSRGLPSVDDHCAADLIGRETVTASGRFSDMILAIVSSPQFAFQKGEAP